MRITAQAESNWTYQEALKVLTQLREVGIDCGITVGGIWLTFDLESQGASVVHIIKSNGGVFCHQTMLQGLSLEAAEKINRENIIAKLEKLWQSEA